MGAKATPNRGLKLIYERHKEREVVHEIEVTCNECGDMFDTVYETGDREYKVQCASCSAWVTIETR